MELSLGYLVKEKKQEVIKTEECLFIAIWFYLKTMKHTPKTSFKN